jgi:hypothetical protein
MRIAQFIEPEEQGLCRQRTVGEGLLRAVRATKDRITHFTKEQADLHARLFEMLDQSDSQ